MARPKVMTVYGTRPEAIKLAPVVRAVDNDDRFDLVSVSTGQHREMLNQVNARFGISLSYDLALMKPEQTLNELVSRVLTGLDDVISAEKPDVMIVQGDTSTAMAAALAGFHQRVKIVHLEAGLRTGNLDSPYPEEANRRMVAQFSTLHLAPTQDAKLNLLNEGIDTRDIAVIGNTVIDALLTAAEWHTTFSDPHLEALVGQEKRLVLVTAHRRENLDYMADVGYAVRELAALYPEVNFVLPLHLNPRVRGVVQPIVHNLPNVLITEPLPYDEFTKLMKIAHVVLTDSGGVQEEAPSLGTPVLLMRDNTERPEAVRAGTVKLVGTNRHDIVASVTDILNDAGMHMRMANATNPYGDGHAAERAVEAIAALFGLGEKVADFAPLELESSFYSA